MLVYVDMTEPTVYLNQWNTTVYCIHTCWLSYKKVYKNDEPDYFPHHTTLTNCLLTVFNARY